MAVIETAEKFIYPSGLCTITVHTGMWEFGKFVFASISYMHYSATVHMFHVHQGYLDVFIITT
jgi:hypothetical protein